MKTKPPRKTNPPPRPVRSIQVCLSVPGPKDAAACAIHKAEAATRAYMHVQRTLAL